MAGVLILTLVVLALLLAAFIYQIVTTPLTAVDAPTLARSAAASATAASATAAQALPSGLARLPAVPAATSPAPVSASLQAPGRRSRSAAALTIAGLAALVIGGWLFLHIAHGAPLCAHQAIEICSQGYVLLTGSQLAGGAIALAGLVSIVIAAVLALR